MTALQHFFQTLRQKACNHWVPTTLVLAAVCAPPSAQNTVSATSIFLHKGRPIPAECQKAAQIFSHLAALYLHPASGWTFVIVCDEGSWKRIMDSAGFKNDPAEHYGETDIDKNVTLIRGYSLLYPEIGGPSPDHIVAHELAHIVLHSRDENLVDHTALKWIEAYHAPEVATR